MTWARGEGEVEVEATGTGGEKLGVNGVAWRERSDWSLDVEAAASCSDWMLASEKFCEVACSGARHVCGEGRCVGDGATEDVCDDEGPSMLMRGLRDVDMFSDAMMLRRSRGALRTVSRCSRCTRLTLNSLP